MSSKTLGAACGALALLAAAPALGQQDMSNMAGMTPSAPATPSAEATGVVKRVNAKAGSVTLHHGPIAALGWPAMTMTFKADPALLKGVKSGQTVRFTVKPSGEGGEITAITPQ
jgi:Cu(I)/Ag(I) efflux system protein CusF